MHPTKLILWIGRKKNTSQELTLQKRSLKELDPNCDSEIVHWSKPKGVAVTVFLLWVSAAKALGELVHLECGVAKQANLTSAALADLSDKEITRQTTLHNIAAIDFLLLLYGHRCEEFQGLYCLTLSSKAEDVYKSINKMRDMIKTTKKETAGWMSCIFEGWGLLSWTGLILKTGLLILFVIVTVLIAFSIIKQML